MPSKKKKFPFTLVSSRKSKPPMSEMSGVYRGPAPLPTKPAPGEELPYPLNHAAEADTGSGEGPEPSAMFLDVYAGPPMPPPVAEEDAEKPADTPTEEPEAAPEKKPRPASPMVCVYAGPEYFARKAKPLPPQDTPMMCVYAGPDYFAGRQPKSVADLQAETSGLGFPGVSAPAEPPKEEPQLPSAEVPAAPRRSKFCAECGAPYGDAEVCPACGLPRPEKP